MLRSLQASNFCNPDVVVQSWFAAMPSRRLRHSQPQSCQLAERRIVVYRGADGIARAADGDCPHLGADLSQGTVTGNGLRCAFHHWCFDQNGNCASTVEYPPRLLRMYPVQERWGFVWIFNGPAPLFPLPNPAASLSPVRLPGQTIACHPHLVLANGIDATHLQAVHGLLLTAEPTLHRVGDYEIAVEMRGRPTSRIMRRITGCNRRDFAATFSAIGGHLAHLRVSEPLAFEVIFTGWPTANGGCQTRTLLFTQRRLGLRFLQSLICLYMIVAADRRILERINFSSAFAQSDAPLAALAGIVDRMPKW